MPLMSGKSKKAFEHNLKAEMHAGKPQDQSLAIAYSIQRGGKKRKKHAEGGAISAHDEKRPMPEDHHNDAIDIRENDHQRKNGEDGWTDKPTAKQAQSKGKSQPIKHPRMVPTDAYSTRLYDREGHLQESDKPGLYDAQPEKWMDEEDAKKMGKGPDMAPEHSTSRKPYAKGGEIEPSDEHHPENMYEDSHLSHLSPSHDEGLMYADEHDEMDKDAHGPDVPDMEREHSNGRKPYARGGEVSPDEEQDMEHEDSIAAAIMAKKARERGHEAGMSDSDIDEMVMLYDGGEVALESEHMEETNNEDQMSFEALKKENYNSSDLDMDQPMDSNEHSPEHEKMDDHDEDMISEIRRRMKHKQFKHR